MAAEVPVSDVLCEAMEYLSKLGSNLRTRSENLKEKRICKAKLKNAHAVQKAASKVLLICELSKKSLDNVETGVRKVLSLLEASQASSNIGGNSSDTKRRSSKEYHYFEYQSRKLRIAKKIPLKHFLSVKVLAKSLPTSMQEKYPVYYDCKLKRHRKRLAKKQKIEISRKRSVCTSDKEDESEKSDCDESSKKHKPKPSRKRSDCTSDKEKETEKSDGEKTTLDDNRASNSNQKLADMKDKSLEKASDSEKKKNSMNYVSQNESEQQKRKSFGSAESEEKKDKKGLHTDSVDDCNTDVKSVDQQQIQKLSTVKCSDSESKIDEKSSVSHTHRKSKDHKADAKNRNEKENKKKTSKSKYAAIYSSDSDVDTQKEICESNENSKVNLCSDEDKLSGNDSSVHEPTAKKLKLNESNANSDNNSNDSEKESKTNKNSGKDDDSGRDRDSDSNSQDAKSCKDSQNESGSESKPIIRCVNLSKLLKPDILSKDGPNNKNKKIDPMKSNKNKSSSSKKTSDTNKKDQSKKKIHKKADEEYWAHKRKEVSEFKPKKFSINIERLPSLSKSFLLTHNLQIITKGGSVICELPKDSDDVNLNNIDAVKNALLNDSESDETADTNKVKKSLLKDSDSDHDLSENDESDKNSKKKDRNNIAHSIQNALRNLDSDLENTNEPDSDNNCAGTNTNDKQSEVEKQDTNRSQNKLSSQGKSSQNDNNDMNEECQNENNENDEDISRAQCVNDQENNSTNDRMINSEVDKNVAECRESNEKSSTKSKKRLVPNSDKNRDLTAKTNEEVKSALLNNSSDEEFAGFGKSDQKTPTNDKVKSLLLNDFSDDEAFVGFSNNDQETPSKTNLKIKCSLLNDSSDDNDQQSATKTNKETMPSLLNNAADDLAESSRNNQETPPSNDNQEKKSTDEKKIDSKIYESSSKTNDEVKSSLLDNSSGEDRSGKETPSKKNENVKSSLLKDSSDDKSHKESSDKDSGKVKTCKENKSSDASSDSSSNEKEKKKSPKSKRKDARKSREAKKKLKYSSSSDSEQEQQRHKRLRKKSRISTSSSSSEEKTKNTKEGKSKKSKFNSSQSDNNTASSINQVDGPMDGQSDSSVSKMVRSKAKPSGSSSQNSDNQDATDKDIDGLTNLNSLNKTRRRDLNAKSRDSGTDSIKKISRSKDTPILGEDLLKAESSSDDSDAAENEFEELPPVTLSGLNGDSIVDHMAKTDLLVESDSSISHNDKDQTETTDKTDETDGEENLKLKRRKANAISSDSEGGTHNRKQKAGGKRLSDFEDSEDESSEPANKSKRKKKVSDSDDSLDSDGAKKKRRRIKIVRDSDVSGSDTENEGRNKHGRKNIRKVMGKNQLEEATKKAAREEKERIARIAERQKLYNNLEFDETGKPDEVVLEKVVLDFDPETKEPLIQVDRGLVKKLKPHQANGIKFMWDACFESVKRIKKDKGSGCILAHCMGLGKTLQVISLTHTLLTHGSLTGVNRVLVVCPLSTVLNWVNEFRMWLKFAEAEFDVDVYELSRYKQNSERAFQLQQWLDGGGVCVLGYEMFRNLSADNNKKFKKKMLRSFQESLVDPGPDLVVCDEGHLLKNEKTSLSQSMNRVKTRRRIVLTGTPLQNNLKEYYCMVQFVKPNLLGKYNEYLNRFVNPITNGQYTDSTEHDIRVMKRRSHVLHKMLDGAVQRRDYGVLAPFLPPKHEFVLFITLTDVQVKLYQYYLDNYSRRPQPGKSSGFLFPDFQSLQRIWTHPLVLKYNSERYEIMQQKKREREEEDSEGSLVDFIDDDSTPDESSTEESSDDLSDMSDDSRKKSKKKKAAKKGKGKESKASTRRGTRANPVELDDEDHVNDEVEEVKRDENPTEWWIKLVEETELDDMRNSHKLVLLFDILRQCETIGDKLLVFSQSLYSLDLIEHFLGKVDEATQEGRIDEKLGGHVGSWSPGVDYFRLDGSTSCENRSIWCKNFNREDNPRARLFLISTRAGGLGINLVAANRVVIFDVSWNPSHDVQSIFRVYRFGQKKPCYIYRFLAMGTMEEKIYERQVTKQAISKRVIDEQQIDRHYAENDLAELYKFEARPEEPRPLPPLPKDRLFAEMLREHEAQIYKYHEHDSLLENKEEETLSEEERKAAWEDFENEKNKPPPAPFPSAWPMHNGMVPGLLAQQQQQLAYAALAAMLRKDMPNINDNQIRDMLPIIYNSNPGLMQKMSEIYKYAQPSMMNPSMMNPVMNAGGGGGMGGTSGLQYEPPWQRQHQQQQQMRLQQLMQQQQNQMGAKFYAGGLGSRDPVAMALQQQRAREIMMGGGGAARPRGRPPARPAPTASSDVVNLDSD